MNLPWLFSVLCGGDLGEGLLLNQLHIYFLNAFYYLKKWKEEEWLLFLLCTSFSEEGYFSEDFLNNMSLASQLE